MRDEGCDWSLLFSSGMGVPLYEGLSYRLYAAPYLRGTFVGDQLPPGDISPVDRGGAPDIVATVAMGGSYSVTRVDGPFDVADRHWQAVRHTYATYNSKRSLSLVRDDGYWHGYFAQSLSMALRHGTLSLFLARERGRAVDS